MTTEALKRPPLKPAMPYFAAAAAALILGAVVHLAVDAARHSAPWTNNDTALILFLAQEMDRGARLYVDWVDTSLPSTFFVALAAVRLARTGLPVVLAYDVMVLATALVGLAVLVGALRDMKRPDAVVVMTAAAYLFFLMKPGPITRDFGQREHLFALLLIPELFAIARPRRTVWRPLWCAALSFVAMIKPHFAVIVAVLELTASRVSRPRAIDLGGLAAGAAASIGLLWLHSPESFAALFTEALTLHTSGAYALLNRSPSAMLARGPFAVLGIAVISLGAMAVAAREKGEVRRMAIRGGAALAWALLAVLHQQKYFAYHFTPLFGIAVVCGAWAVGECLARNHRDRPTLILAIALASVGAVSFHRDVAANDDPLAVRLGRAVEGPARILVVSVYAHGLCTPYLEAPRCLGPKTQVTRLPALAYEPDADRQLSAWAESVGATIREQRPELLALSTSDQALPDGLTPAGLLLERFHVLPDGEYARLSAEAEAGLRARGWTILRRRDVRERDARQP